jgi:capsular exopolysaccharide synthesis family protein
MMSNPYIMPLIKWWRLIAIVTILAAGVSAISTMFQQDIYLSKTTLVIGTTLSNANPDSGQIYIAQQLAQIYADMARREPVQQATMQALGITWLPAYASRVVPNTQMIEISVTDTNPKRAQIIANELASQLMLQSPTLGNTETGSRQDFITEQLSSLQNQIQDTEKQLEELQKSLVGLNSASQIANIEKQISAQTEKLSTLRKDYASLLENSTQGSVNTLSVVEPANLPFSPTGTNRLTIILLAGLVGFSLGTGAAYLLEFLDRTLKTTSDVERVFNLPVIGYITEISGDGRKGSYVSDHPQSILAENFRLLCSNINFYQASHPIQTILITSPNQGAGKTTVAANLAWSLAQEEKKVLLLDADLRRPAVHASLGIDKEYGLADVIRNKASLDGVTKSMNSEGCFRVITAGRTGSRTFDISGSNRIAGILSELKQKFELVIVDAPPLIIADSYNLASTADVVIIVIEPSQTPEEQARTIKEQLDRAGAKVIGVVFNRISEESANAYYDSKYRSLYSPKYYGDYHGETPKEPATSASAQSLISFFEHGRIPPEVKTAAEHAIAEVKKRGSALAKRSKS